MNLRNDHMEASPKFSVIAIFNRLLDYAWSASKDAANSETAYTKYCGFRTYRDWFKYRAAVDLLQDTDYAILEVFHHQLGKIPDRNISESYLRLYGVLNAVYLQIGAYSVLSRMLHYPQADKLISPLRESKIYLYRNIAGAHSFHMEANENHKHLKSRDHDEIKSFRIVQTSLRTDGKGISLISQNHETYEFDLINELWDYEVKSREVLLTLLNHMIMSRIKKKQHKEETLEELQEKLKEFCDYRHYNLNEKRGKAMLKSAIKKSKSQLKKLGIV